MSELRIFVVVQLTMLLLLQACTELTKPETSGEKITSIEFAGVAPHGSGWSRVENTIVNYEYNNFSGFNLIWENGHIRWQGYDGAYYEGVIRQRPAQVSEVSPGIYFTSWPGVGTGGDNIVHDMKKMNVFAHLGNADGIIQIAGEVQCWNDSNCDKPGTEQTPDDVTQPMIEANTARLGLTPRSELRKPGRAPLPAHLAARNDLSGKVIIFEAQQGPTKIEINDAVMRVSEAGRKALSQQTYATKISENVYLISWQGPFGGNHMLFNLLTGKVYDHLLPDGKRGEQIYTISCFDSVNAC